MKRRASRGEGQRRGVVHAVRQVRHLDGLVGQLVGGRLLFSSNRSSRWKRRGRGGAGGHCDAIYSIVRNWQDDRGVFF